MDLLVLYIVQLYIIFKIRNLCIHTFFFLDPVLGSDSSLF